MISHEQIVSIPVMNTSSSQESDDDSSEDENAADNYVVLFNGGWKPNENYHEYYTAIKRLYTAVTTTYHVDPKNVYIIFADGTDPALDQNLASKEHPELANSDMSFATNKGTSVYSATLENFQKVMKTVGNKMDSNDHLLLYTTDHGSGADGDTEKIGEEKVSLWGEEDIDVTEFTKAVYQVQEGYVTVAVSQCYGGGMLSFIVDSETGEPCQETNAYLYGMAAANHYETVGNSFEDCLTDYLVNHNASTAITEDAFSYIKKNNKYVPEEEYENNGGTHSSESEHPWGIGESFTIFAPIQLVNPKNLSATIDQTNVSVQWDAVLEASGYTVQYRLSDSEEDDDWTVLEVDDPSATFTGESGSSYDIQVQANGNEAGYSDSEFSCVSLTIPAEDISVQLIAPDDLTTSVNGTSVLVQWDAVFEASGYLAQYRATESDDEWTDMVVRGRTATFTGESETEYSIRVRALGDDDVYTNSRFTKTTITTEEENLAQNYVVLFSGGIEPEQNTSDYYDAIKKIYTTVTTTYKVDPKNVFILSADGTDPGLDQNTASYEEPNLINSDMSYATSQGTSVYSATLENFQAVMKTVGNKMDSNDHLLLYTTDHGNGIDNNREKIGEEILCVWGEKNITVTQFADAVYQVQKGYVTVALSQCYSGGLLNFIVHPKTGEPARETEAYIYGMSAVNHYEATGSHFEDGFIEYLEENNASTAMTEDAFFSIKQSYGIGTNSEAYENNEGAFIIGIEHPWGAGENFSIFANDESDKLSAPEDLNATVDQNSITVAWNAVEYATGYILEYKGLGMTQWEVITDVDETSYCLEDLDYENQYNIRVRAVDSTETWRNSNYSYVTSVTDLSEWNLADEEYEAYTEFRIDMTYNRAYLFGIQDGQETTLKDVVSYKGASLSIVGDKTVRALTISTGAMENLETLTYTGGSRDRIFVEGSNLIETYTISREQKTDENGDSNPYKKVQRSRSIYETISLKQEEIQCATLKLKGVNQITIDAKQSPDTFRINQLGTNYVFYGGNGSDKIDFTESSRTVLNMNVTYKQYAVSGQIGSIALNGDIEEVIGSRKNDRIISAENTTSVTGNGGIDSLIINGNKQTSTTVNLAGKSQCVVLQGDGTYQIEITDGADSVINATAVSDMGKINVDASGDRITVLGSAGDDKIEVTGKYANIYGRNGNDTVVVTGSHATIYGGKGNDSIVVKKAEEHSSGNNVVYGGAGNDFIYLKGTDGRNYVYAGTGDDILIGGEGIDYLYAQYGNNLLIGYDGADYLYGGSGRDLFIANTTQLMKEKTSKESKEEQFYRELAAQWAEDSDLDEIVELIGKQSIADDEQDRLFRGGGKNNLFYCNSETDGDTVAKNGTDTVFSDLLDEPE